MALATIFAGGYSSVIVSYVFDPTERTLSYQNQFDAGDNPSWITLRPDGQALYAVNEVPDGAVARFMIANNTGQLALQPPETISSGGSSPVHIGVLDDGSVAVANYGEGNCVVIPNVDNIWTADGTQVIPFDPPSKPHQVFQYKQELLVPDLDADKVWRLGRVGGTWTKIGFIDQLMGSGPRHAVVSNDVIFTLHESSNTLTAQRFDVNEPSNPAQFIGSVMITPELTNGTQFNAAELLVPPGSDASQGLLLYASNRNKGPTFDDQEDCITIVRYTPAPTPGAADTLTFVRQWPTGLREIRGMAFSNDGKYLVAGGQMNGIVKVFQVGPDDMLAEIANSTVGGGRTSFVWMDQ